LELQPPPHCNIDDLGFLLVLVLSDAEQPSCVLHITIFQTSANHEAQRQEFLHPCLFVVIDRCDYMLIIVSSCICYHWWFYGHRYTSGRLVGILASSILNDGKDSGAKIVHVGICFKDRYCEFSQQQKMLYTWIKAVRSLERRLHSLYRWLPCNQRKQIHLSASSHLHSTRTYFWR
jgi:hypothetical protein